jgi:hypothetical protein
LIPRYSFTVLYASSNCKKCQKTCISLRQSWVCAVQEDGILDRSRDSHVHCIGQFRGPSHPIPSHVPMFPSPPPNLHDAPSKCLTSCRRGAVRYSTDGLRSKAPRLMYELTPPFRERKKSKQANTQSISSPISDCNAGRLPRSRAIAAHCHCSSLVHVSSVPEGDRRRSRSSHAPGPNYCTGFLRDLHLMRDTSSPAHPLHPLHPLTHSLTLSLTVTQRLFRRAPPPSPHAVRSRVA